jgi:tRNA (guanine37-N1)-methyltransferase
MKISIVTVFPELYEQFLKTSLIARAIEKKILDVQLVRFSDMCEPKERIDESTCGHGVGMVLKPEVVEKAIEHSEKTWGKGYKIFFSPQGKKLEQPWLKEFASEWKKEKEEESHGEVAGDHIILVCGRYEGFDARVETHYADLTLSIGDYVLMGGDIPAQVFLEAFLRYFPGVVGKQESVEEDSFSGAFFDYPEFGLPVEWKGEKIPEVVLSGNHKQLDEWRRKEACKNTIKKRFDWITQSNLSEDSKALCNKNIPNHYVALMHSEIIVKGRGIGHTSVTSLDLHDIARSSATYGVENVFMVSQLEDQRAIMKEFLGFWLSEKGQSYNASRFEAVRRVVPTDTLDNVKQFIREREGVDPILVSTSAKVYGHAKKVEYHSQGMVWEQGRPILLVFGTGQGLGEHVLEQSDFLLEPVYGLTNYNHLSVRSAVAIILDRWLGLNPKLIYT